MTFHPRNRKAKPMLRFCLPTCLVALSMTSVPVIADSVFNRLATFPVASNLPAGLPVNTETSAEIIAASEDGNLLVYTDSPLGGIGLIDIGDAGKPRPAGFVKLDGEPTSVTVRGGKAWVAVNTSTSFTAPAGHLSLVDLASATIESRCELGGQPDSIAISPDGSFLAIAIENERDEGLDEGALPQLPAGFVTRIPVSENAPLCDDQVRVELTGLAEVAGDDPEPEFVDINDNGDIVVTLQENNQLAVIDSSDGQVSSSFPAGSVDLQGIDTREEGALVFTDSQMARAREPDAVQWLDAERFVTANEGDYQGGSRGFSIFSRSGNLLFDSGTDFEYRAIRAGHYPEKRSGNKGIEPEGLEVAQFGDSRYIVVLAERASLAAIYLDTGDAPEFVQLLPTGLAPEGVVAIPARNLLVVSSEADLVADNGPRANVMIYELQDAAPRYPHIVSDNDADGKPIGWGALSGLTADAEKPGLLYAVNDSFYKSQPSIFTIDASQNPARITHRLTVRRSGAAAQLLDLEGITGDGENGFWLASEGRSDRLIPHALYHVDADGEIDASIAFPPELLINEKRFGAEGIARLENTLWVAIQRPWEDDPQDRIKLLAYDTANDSWGAVHYPLDATERGWVGVSELTIHDDKLYVLERDNGIGASAGIKRLYSVSLDQLKPAPLGTELPVVNKQLVLDLLPMLQAQNGYVPDKVEGFSIDAAGQAYMVTDNDGVDDSSGETIFMSIDLRTAN